MSDFNTPSLGDLYISVLQSLRDRDVSALTLCISDPSNIPANAMKWDRAGLKFQEYITGAWSDRILAIAGGGTGSADAASARSSLGLGTMAVQNSNAVTITGGAIAANIDALSIVSGLIAQSILGSGSGGAGKKVLLDNQTWGDATPTGTGALWFTATPPTGWIILDGSNISRTGLNATLFALWSTTFGAGDGSTTFGIPDLRQRFPLGKAASGTGNTLGATGGAIDHLHSSAAHTHGISGVYPHSHTGSVAISDPGHSHNYRAFASGGGLVYLNDNGFTTDDDGTSGVIKSATTGITATPTIDSAGSTVATDSTIPGNTGTNNPPFFVVNFMVKL